MKTVVTIAAVIVILTALKLASSIIVPVLIAAGLVVLTWVPTVLWPRFLVGLTGALASASLYIYLTHWQVYPHLEDRFPLAATLLSLAAGIAFWWAASRAMPHVERSLVKAWTGARQVVDRRTPARSA
mgnify:CR=1 FL=1